MINFSDIKYSPCDAQWIWIILSSFLKDESSLTKLLFLPLTPFDILLKKTYRNKYLKYFKIPKVSHDINFKSKDIEPGKSIKIYNGKDLSIFCTGTQLKNAINLRSKLQKDGIKAELIYIHTIKPLDDKSIIRSIRKTKKFF